VAYANHVLAAMMGEIPSTVLGLDVQQLVPPSYRRELWEQLREYNRPGFHPDDRDTNGLVDHWRDELFGEAGTLNDKLAGAAA
jgi:hypothetical protein